MRSRRRKPTKLYLALKIRSLVHCIFNYILTLSHIQIEDLLNLNAILFQELSLSLSFGAADKRVYTCMYAAGIRQRLPQLITNCYIVGRGTTTETPFARARQYFI